MIPAGNTARVDANIQRVNLNLKVYISDFGHYSVQHLSSIITDNYANFHQL